jgi:phospholipase A1/A2
MVLLPIHAALAGATVDTLDDALARCRTIDESAARLACYDALVAPPASSVAGAAPATGGIVPSSPGPTVQSSPGVTVETTSDAAGVPPSDAAADTARSAPSGGHSVDTGGAGANRAPAGKGASINTLAADARCPSRSVDGYAVSPLSELWELDDKCGRFGLRTYRPNYLLFGRYSNAPDAYPTSPTHPAAPAQSARRTEAKFQVSLRFKLLEDLPLGGADVWAAYTQQSSWQLYDSANSRPFRETDYEPEIMVVLPTRYDTHLFGLTGRYVSLGIVHQSNGQSDPLSRSWNRVYGQFGFDAGGFSLQVRPWVRLREPISSDDNPDIEHYLGHMDLVASYSIGKVEASLLLRDNLHEHSNRGSAKLDLSFRAWPQRNLRFYLQAFAGYGETLIDYNHRQTTVGLGIMLDQ